MLPTAFHRVSPSSPSSVSVRGRGRRRRLRDEASVFGAVFLGALFVACGDPVSNVITAVAPKAIRAPSPLDASAAIVAHDLLTEVEGFVVNDDGEPIVGRPIVVVDAARRLRERMTDEAGTFHVSDVAEPYDLLVASAPSGMRRTPTAYLGLRRSDPWIEVSEHFADPPPEQVVRLDVPVACALGASSCWMAVTTASPSGAGMSVVSFGPGVERQRLDVVHRFRVAAVPFGETIDVHAVVADAECTEFAYARHDGIAAEQGTMASAALTPRRVDGVAPVDIRTSMSGSMAAWPLTIHAWLDLPGGASVELARAPGPVAMATLPVLPGATFHVRADAVDDRLRLHASEAWSGPLPIGLTEITLQLVDGPKPRRPVRAGSVSRRSGVLWTGAHESVVSVGIREAHEGPWFVVAHTRGQELPFERLEALGLAFPEAGPYELSIASETMANVDVMTDPDRVGRSALAGGRGRERARAGGATTYERFGFEMTP